MRVPLRSVSNTSTRSLTIFQYIHHIIMFTRNIARTLNPRSIGLSGLTAPATTGVRLFSGSTALKQVQELTSFEDYKTLINKEKVSIIDFYATWCGPCKAIEPIMEQLSERVPQATFARVDVDEHSDVAQDNQITAMPTIKF